MRGPLGRHITASFMERAIFMSKELGKRIEELLVRRVWLGFCRGCSNSTGPENSVNCIALRLLKVQK